MSEMIGYGEDALTLWALKHRLAEILGQIGDSSPPDSCLAIYRPSFGRSGGLRASFGEFDSILASEDSIYLIESKWDGQPHKRKWKVKLGEAQILRHQVFSWYFERWNRGENWASFVKRHEEEFERKFDEKAMAKDGSRLSENLIYVMSRLAEHLKNEIGEDYGENVTNVLLFLECGEHTSPSCVDSEEEFRLIIIRYPKLPRSHYVDICQARHSA